MKGPTIMRQMTATVTFTDDTDHFTFWRVGAFLLGTYADRDGTVRTSSLIPDPIAVRQEIRPEWRGRRLADLVGVYFGSWVTDGRATITVHN